MTSARLSVRVLRPGLFGTTTRGALERGAQRGIESGRHLSRAVLIKATRRHKKVVFQTFLLGWHEVKIADGRCFGGYRHHVYNTAPYAAVIEKGRRPGAKMPPPDALKPWVEKKLKPHKDAVKQRRSELRDQGRAAQARRRAIRASGGYTPTAGSLARSHKAASQQNLRALADQIIGQVALNVARKIHYRGIKPTPILGERIEKLADLTLREVTREIKLALETAFKGF